MLTYFAYGSNMNLPRLQDWLQSFGGNPEGIRNPRRVVVPNFRFRTNYLTTRRLGAANIEPCPGNSVEGVLIKLSPMIREALRAKEGFPKRYNEIEIKVTDALSRMSITAFTYQVTSAHRLPFDVPVSPRYRGLILEGAAAARLSNEYQSHLREILKNNTSDDSHTRCA